MLNNILMGIKWIRLVVTEWSTFFRLPFSVLQQTNAGHLWAGKREMAGKCKIIDKLFINKPKKTDCVFKFAR